MSSWNKLKFIEISNRVLAWLAPVYKENDHLSFSSSSVLLTLQMATFVVLKMCTKAYSVLQWTHSGTVGYSPFLRETRSTWQLLDLMQTTSSSKFTVSIWDRTTFFFLDNIVFAKLDFLQLLRKQVLHTNQHRTESETGSVQSDSNVWEAVWCPTGDQCSISKKLESFKNFQKYVIFPFSLFFQMAKSSRHK